MIQIWTARTPQGYEYRQYGTSDRTLLDFEGLALVTVMKKAKPAGPPEAGAPSDLLTTEAKPKARKPRAPKAPAPPASDPLPTAWMFDPSNNPTPDIDANRNSPPGPDEQLDTEMPW